jgi:hypothetical protein
MFANPTGPADIEKPIPSFRDGSAFDQMIVLIKTRTGETGRFGPYRYFHWNSAIIGPSASGNFSPTAFLQCGFRSVHSALFCPHFGRAFTPQPHQAGATRSSANRPLEAILHFDGYRVTRAPGVSPPAKNRQIRHLRRYSQTEFAKSKPIRTARKSTASQRRERQQSTTLPRTPSLSHGK